MRRFLVNVTQVLNRLDDDVVLTFSLKAMTGDNRIHYADEKVDNIVIHPSKASDPTLFYQDTTTQVYVKIDRWGEAGKIVKIK